MKKLLAWLVFVGILFGAATVIFADLVQLEEGEYGVVFSSLPIFIGGGISDAILNPGENEYILPWEKLYKLDTSLQSVSWGAKGEGKNKEGEDYVETRSIDGNEVGLATTVQYTIEPDKVAYVVKYVGTSSDKIDLLVSTTARADIRTHMNALNTRDFFDSFKRNEAVEKVKYALNQRLEIEGIKINDVIFHDYRFERRRADGSYDRSYQEQIDEEQSTRQKIKEEEQKINAVTQGKLSELEQARAITNARLEQAKGERRQAEYRGDQYLNAKRIEADRIKKVGENQVTTLQKQIESLNSPGGEALLKLEIAKQLLKSKPKFMLLNPTSSSGGSSIEVNRIDTNELIRQAGIFSALQEDQDKKPPTQSINQQNTSKIPPN